MNLSVIMPVSNEVESIQVILKCGQVQNLAHEIVVVDDDSKDGKDSVRVILHERNKGKGAAVRTGMAAALGDVLLVQDADLEYDPRYYTLGKKIKLHDAFEAVWTGVINVRIRCRKQALYGIFCIT